MTKLPGKGHDEAALAAAKHYVATVKPEASEKDVDALADKIQKATDQACDEWMRVTAAEEKKATETASSKK